MVPRKKTSGKNGAAIHLTTPSVWRKIITASSEWQDKDQFLDVIYWSRQIIGLLVGLIWGIIPLKGFFGIAVFCIINAGLLYIYCTMFQKVDEDEFGGIWEITKEGFMTSFAGFLVTWIIVYSALHFG